MNFLPFQRLELYSPLAPADLQRKLASITCSKFFSLSPKEPFRGKVEDKTFKIVRAIRYKNSWIPVVVGEMSPSGTGSLVRVRMRLIWLVAAFMFVWFSAALTGLAAGLAMLAGGEPDALAVAGGAGLMAVLAYAMMSGFFWYEVGKARALLELHLECREPEKAPRGWA